jgi:hypothetical protein
MYMYVCVCPRVCVCVCVCNESSLLISLLCIYYGLRAWGKGTARCFGSGVEWEELTGTHGKTPRGSGDKDGGGAFGGTSAARGTDFIDAKISGQECLSAYILSSGLEDSFFLGGLQR